MKRTTLAIEELEPRCVPSSLSAVRLGTLLYLSDPDSSETIQISGNGRLLTVDAGDFHRTYQGIRWIGDGQGTFQDCGWQGGWVVGGLVTVQFVDQFTRVVTPLGPLTIPDLPEEMLVADVPSARWHDDVVRINDAGPKTHLPNGDAVHDHTQQAVVNASGSRDDMPDDWLLHSPEVLCLAAVTADQLTQELTQRIAGTL